MKTRIASIAIGFAALTGGGFPTVAHAAETESATLTCGPQSFTVTGFGRGEVLHVVGSNANFVVTFAQIEPSGQVIIDVRGHQDRDNTVTCSATTPTGKPYTFRGFFTPSA